MPAQTRRLGALLLLVALVGGGLGLPLFDALVYHSQPLPPSANAVMPQGAPLPHTQLCILDQPGLATPSVASRAPVLPAVLPMDVAVLPAPVTAPAAHLPGLLPRPRAPPIA